MDWAVIAGIIAQEGLAVAQAVYAKWLTNQMPTTADFVQLMELGKETPQSLVIQAAAMAGLPATDPKVAEILKLLSAPAAPPATP